jgi:hypothetical protein
MKPQPTIDPNAAGDEVKRLLAEDGSASAALKDLRSAKAARKEALKSALEIVWAAFDKKQTVNGFATRKEWAKEFAKVTPRHCEHIIYGRTERKANHGSVALKPGTVVIIGGKKFTVTAAPESANDMTKIKGESDKFRVSLLVTPVAELSKKLRKFEPCPECGLHASIVDGKYGKHVGNNKQYPCPASDTVVTPVEPSKKKEKRYSQKVHPGFMTMPGKPHRTHKMSNDGKRTWCGKTPGLTLATDARMVDEPTCKGCRLGEYTDKARVEAYGKPPKSVVNMEKFDKQQAEQVTHKKRHVGSSKKESSAYSAVTRKIQKLIDQCRAGSLAKEGYLTDEEYRRELRNIHDETLARPLFQNEFRRQKFKVWWTDPIGRAEAAMDDRRVFEERLKSGFFAEEREEEPTQVTVLVCPDEEQV